jgi:hypothetical protein
METDANRLTSGEVQATGSELAKILGWRLLLEIEQ